MDKRPTLLRCPSCHKDVSLTAGTIMHRTKVSLLKWFWGAYLVTSETPGMSAVQFARQLGIKCHETAYMMLQKLRAAMVRPDREMIGGEWSVQIDETFIGGRVRKGKGRHEGVTVVGAVEIRADSNGDTYAGRVRLQVVPAAWQEVLDQFVLENILPGTKITTDGSQGYDHLTEMGYKHRQITMDGDPVKLDKYLPMIHIVFSNLKAWLLGTFHGVSPKHLPAYLNEFVFRFNRRFYPMSAFNSVLGIGMQVEGPSYDGLYKGTWTHPTLGEVG